MMLSSEPQRCAFVVVETALGPVLVFFTTTEVFMNVFVLGATYLIKGTQ